MGRFYWADNDACYDKKHDILWILGVLTVCEDRNGWNHWGIFGVDVEFRGSYWWWGEWDPLDPRPDIDWDPYWGEPPDRYGCAIAIDRLLEQCREYIYTTFGR